MGFTIFNLRCVSIYVIYSEGRKHVRVNGLWVEEHFFLTQHRT